MTPLIPDPEIWANMSLRERQIFCALCEGMSDKQLAFRFEISTNTVKVHLRKLFKTVNVHTRTALVVKICNLQAPRPLGVAARTKELVSL